MKHPDWLWTVCTYCFSTSVQSVTLNQASRVLSLLDFRKSGVQIQHIQAGGLFNLQSSTGVLLGPEWNPFANNPSLTVTIHWFNEFHILRLVIQHQLVRSWTPPPTESRPWLTTPNSSTGKVSTFHSPTFVFVQSRVFSIAGGRRALTSAIPHEASTLARHWPVPSYQLPLSMSDSEFTSAL